MFRPSLAFNDLIAASFDRLALFWGEEKATAFLQKFAKQVAGLIRCGEEERVANGEFAMLAFNCDMADANDMREKGAPVNGKILRDAGILSYWYLAVPTNATLAVAAAGLADALNLQANVTHVLAFPARN